MPVWHASVSIPTQPPGNGQTIVGDIRPTLTSSWSDRKLERAIQIAKDLIGSRGVPPYRVERGLVAVHVRRRLSDADRASLPAGWLDTPAVDKAGGGIRLIEFEAD